MLINELYATEVYRQGSQELRDRAAEDRLAREVRRQSKAARILNPPARPRLRRLSFRRLAFRHNR